MRILVAEGNTKAAANLVGILQQLGHRVDVAEGGEEAWKRLQKRSYTLAFFDSQLPGLSGLELCRRVRAHPTEGVYCYIIVTTPRADRDSRLSALAAGGDDVLVKPLDSDELSLRLQIAKRILDMQAEAEQRAHDYRVATEHLTCANEMLEVASRRFEALFNGLPVACFTFDVRGVVYEWNDAAAELWRVHASEALHQPVLDLIAERSNRKSIEQLIDTAMRNERTQNLDIVFMDANDEPVYTRGQTFPLHGPDGRVVGGLSAFIDVTEIVNANRTVEAQLVQISDYSLQLEQRRLELEDLNRKLDVFASTDGLTGLCNRRVFMDSFRDVVPRALRTKTPLSILLLDIDHFKKFNDDFGHQAGDEVLVAVSRRLLDFSGGEVIAARYGGEEFIVLLPGHDRDAATAYAERLRAAISGMSLHGRGVTASIGVATWGRRDTTDLLISRADEALYASKDAGRNCVTHAEDLPEAAA